MPERRTYCTGTADKDHIWEEKVVRREEVAPMRFVPVEVYNRCQACNLLDEPGDSQARDREARRERRYKGLRGKVRRAKEEIFKME